MASNLNLDMKLVLKLWRSDLFTLIHLHICFWVSNSSWEFYLSVGILVIFYLGKMIENKDFASLLQVIRVQIFFRHFIDLIPERTLQCVQTPRSCDSRLVNILATLKIIWANKGKGKKGFWTSRFNFSNKLKECLQCLCCAFYAFSKWPIMDMSNHRLDWMKNWKRISMSLFT